MSNPSFRVPEPRLPEHQLLRESGPLPQLSTGLRERVMRDCHRQICYGRWADRLRVIGAVLVASLMVALVWHFRWTGQSDRAQLSPGVAKSPADQPEPASTYTSANSDSLATPTVEPALPQGGPTTRPDTKEMQQINRLIEDLSGRNNTLCSFLPVW